MINTLLDKYNLEYEMYGKDIAKVKPINDSQHGKVILVTATSPTKYGEGKTTVAIGLNDGLNKLNQKSIVVLREPSLGPVFGTKGGATGGGKAIVVPEDKINLHFTGDIHAITSANNLISSIIDNEIYHDNKLDIQEVIFRRCLDVCDRALKNVKLSDRTERFQITAASEIMVIFCLAKDIYDLRNRIEDIIIGYNSKHEEIKVKDLNITDAVIALLKDSFKPNAVLTGEGNLAFISGGPFANIAHGTSSVIALNTALSISDYVVTEAGFASELGAFKYTDILSRVNPIEIHACVLVTTVRALKYHGEGDLSVDIENLKAHINILKELNQNIIVTLNKFEDDVDEDIKYIKEYVESQNVLFEVNEAYLKGGEGCIDLANKVLSINESKDINYIYNLEDDLKTKIDSYATKICNASNIIYTDEVLEKIKKLNKYKYPICVAKTQMSISDDKKVLGAPSGYDFHISDVEVMNGAKFIVVYSGKITTMPGLSDDPGAKHFKVLDDEIIFPN